MTAAQTMKDIDEILDSLAGSTWRDEKGALYIQTMNDGVELYASPSLRTQTRTTFLTSTTLQTINEWIKTLSIPSALGFVITAEQNLFGELCGMASDAHWKTLLVRMARMGDCQRLGNFGTEEEEKYARAVLSSYAGDGVRSVSIERVIGSDLLLMHANFRFNETEIMSHPFKSCWPMVEIGNYLQRLHFEKGLNRAICTDPKLSSLFVTQGRIAQRIWQTVPPPNCTATQDRLRTASNYENYSHLLKPTEAAKLDWLTAARRAVGLTENGGRSDTKITTRLQKSHIAAYFAAKRAALPYEHEEVLRSIHQYGDPAPPGLELVEITRLIANSGLGRHPTKAQFNIVLREGCKNQIWWEDAVKTLMRNWFATREPVEWFSKVLPSAAHLVAGIATETDSFYESARNALETISPDEMMRILPFETRKLASECETYIEQMAEVLGPNNRLARYKDSENLSELAYYALFEKLAPKSTKPLQRYLLERAKRKWGESRRYFQAVAFSDWLKTPLEETLALCEEWRNKFPNDIEAWRFSARVLANEGRKREALELCEVALRLETPDREGTRRNASLLWQLNEDDAAVSLLEALPKQSNDIATNILLAKIYSHRGNDDLACDLFRGVDNDKLILYNGSYSYLSALARTSEWAEVEGRFQALSGELDETQYAFVLRLAAQRLLYKGRFRHVTVLVPFIQWNMEVWLCLDSICECLAEAGDMAAATDLFEEARAKALAGPDLYFRYSDLLVYAPDPDARKALRLAREGIKKFPNDRWLPLAAASAADAAGEDASKFLLDWIDRLRVKPDGERSLDDIYLLGCAYWYSGSYEEAESTMRSYIEKSKTESACSLLWYAMIAAAVDAHSDADEVYERAARLLNSRSILGRQAVWRSHLRDLEICGQRGVFLDFVSVLARAKRWATR